MVKRNNLSIWMMVRHRKGKELAQRLGVSQQSMVAWRKNKSTPTPTHVLRLCQLLNISQSQFWYDPTEPFIITTPYACRRTAKKVQDSTSEAK